jgi:hypothetical protein
MGAIRDRGLPGRRAALRPPDGCNLQARPGPQAGGRPTQPDQDQKEEDQGEEQGKMHQEKAMEATARKMYAER